MWVAVIDASEISCQNAKSNAHAPHTLSQKHIHTYPAYQHMGWTDS